MPNRHWLCPVTGCTRGPGGEPWRVGETAADVQAVIEAYAAREQGVIPEPINLGPLRSERVEQALAAHIGEHPPRERTRWLA